jgi:hypothetical protein
LFIAITINFMILGIYLILISLIFFLPVKLLGIIHTVALAYRGVGLIFLILGCNCLIDFKWLLFDHTNSVG